jgi:hypothetical protein
MYFYFLTVMRGTICAIPLLILLNSLGFSGYAQSYGLRFSSHEVMQEKRTSLDLSATEPLCFKNEGEISFDLMFAQNLEIYFGYIFRLITTDGQNIDLIYNQKLSNFNFIIGEKVSGTFKIDSLRMLNEWNNFRVQLNTRDHDLLFYVNDKLVGRCKDNLKTDLCFKMYFGTNSYEEFQTADIPPMNLKDIRISENGKTRYYWPLSEVSGDSCWDSVQHKIARVSNPIWIRPQHQTWQLASTFQVAGTPGVAFNSRNDNLYIVGEDSLYNLSLQTLQLGAKRWGDRTELLPMGNQSIFSPLDGKLYSIYIDQKRVRTYDSNTRKWDVPFLPGPATEFWQANKFVSYTDSSLYVLDGYGQLTYKNLVQRYSLADKKWEIVKTTGDNFNPRYLAALGANASGDTAYIMGGYGSTTGDQMASPKYYYDLLSYSVRDRSFKVIYHLKEPDNPFCFANSLIIDPGSDEYYALIYPNDKFNSRLQLINGSLKSPEYRALGDEIPYSFHDIKSFADLYYDPVGKQLIAVTMYTSKENRTDVRVYTIGFPANAIQAAVAPVENAAPRVWLWVIVVIGLGLAGGLGMLWLRRRRAGMAVSGMTGAGAGVGGVNDGAGLVHGIGGHANGGNGGIGQGIAGTGNAGTAYPAAAHGGHEHGAWVPSGVVADDRGGSVSDDRSAVYFFGQFEVYDKGGGDLTKQFTPLLKELFLLIAIYTLRSGKGISSEKLYGTLWRDKSNKDAQNNRSVNMVKLKLILDKLGTCAIVKEADKWIFHYSTDQIRLDLAEFLTLLHMPQPNKEDIQHLLTIVHKGSFLADTAYPWLDDIQSEMSDKALDMFSAACIRYGSDPEFLLEIASGIFLFDPVNEEALRIKCKSLGLLGRHSMAKTAFEKFIKEYQQMYGEEFKQTFQEVIN